MDSFTDYYFIIILITVCCMSLLYINTFLFNKEKSIITVKGTGKIKINNDMCKIYCTLFSDSVGEIETILDKINKEVNDNGIENIDIESKITNHYFYEKNEKKIQIRGR